MTRYLLHMLPSFLSDNIFQQDGALPHYSLKVHQLPDKKTTRFVNCTKKSYPMALLLSRYDFSCICWRVCKVKRALDTFFQFRSVEKKNAYCRSNCICWCVVKCVKWLTGLATHQRQIKWWSFWAPPASNKNYERNGVPSKTSKWNSASYFFGAECENVSGLSRTPCTRYAANVTSLLLVIILLSSRMELASLKIPINLSCFLPSSNNLLLNYSKS